MKPVENIHPLAHPRLQFATPGPGLEGLLPRVYHDVHAERMRAHVKHGANGNSREDAPANDPEWLPILGEEFGEVCHSMTYDADLSERRKELVQVAAMAIAWIVAIDAGQL